MLLKHFLVSTKHGFLFVLVLYNMFGKEYTLFNTFFTYNILEMLFYLIYNTVFWMFTEYLIILYKY